MLNKLACYLIENRIDFEYDCTWDRIVTGNCNLYIWVEAGHYYTIPQMARNGATGPMTFEQVIKRIESHTS